MVLKHSKWRGGAKCGRYGCGDLRLVPRLEAAGRSRACARKFLPRLFYLARFGIFSYTAYNGPSVIRQPDLFMGDILDHASQ